MEKKQSVEEQSLFSSESKLTKGLESLYRLFILNVLFIVLSLPIVTIGIAQMSLYDSIKQLKESPDNRPLAVFVQSVKTHWRQGLKIGLLEIFITFIVWLDMMVINTQIGVSSFVLKAFFYGMSLIIVMTIFYLIPLSLRRKKTNLLTLFKESFLIACIHLPWSLGLMFLSMVLLHLFQLNVLMTMALLSLFMVLGFSCVTYIQSMVIEPLLNKELNV